MKDEESVQRGGKKMANKNKGVYLIVYIFLSYRRTI